MTMIFVNFATTDLDRSKAFYTALGCEINPMFTDENAACLVWSESVFFMVLKREFFATFTKKDIIDAHTSVQTLTALSRESRESVDEILAAGLAAGGSEPGEPQDMGFMYSRQLDDPDGNTMEFMWMSPEAAAQGPESYMAEDN